MKKFSQILGKVKLGKVTKNTIWIMSEKVIQMLISLIVGVLSARYLGPSNYGTLNYGLSLINIFSAITKLGLENIIVKKFVDEEENNGKILGTSLVLRLISSFLSIIMITILVFILKADDTVTIVVTLLQSVSLIFQAYELIEFWFQSKLKSKYVSIAKSISYFIVASYKVILLITNKSVEWFAIANTLDYGIILLIIMIMYKKNNGQKLKFDKKVAKDLLKNSYHFILSGLIVTLYTQMDKIMIGSMIDETNVGLYSAATSICMMWGFIPEALINSIRPTIYESKSKEQNENYLKKLKRLYAIIFWIGVFFAIFITLFSNLIIDILYGEEYLGAKSSLIIAVWYTGFAYLGSARNVWIICEDKNKYSKRYVLIGGVVNLILNAILIPNLGINGAAIATLVSQITVTMIAPIIFKETRISVKYIIEGIFGKGV